MEWTFLKHEMAFTAAPLIHEMDSVTGGAKSLGVGRPPSLTEWGWRMGGGSLEDVAQRAAAGALTPQ
jgi:hypothetical protein